ncbi:aminoglycoside phosphotransferase family protein [Actinoplanes sp. NPDC051411]|uniref:aminoglycoside phosphotransferase family protein n=1 Tax=Actinoplanes sp. NPDC051411 TaxID=3155522 RepID=UPI0034216D6B
MEDLPAAVRAKAHDAGRAGWLTGLPALLGRLSRAWGLTLGAAFGDATEAYVVEATRRDGTPAVLKVHVPGRGGAAAYEILALRAARGEGCARLLEADVDLGALLLERLGPAMSTLGLPPSRRLEILCDLAAAVWRPSDLDLPTGRDRAARTAESIERRWERLGRPCRAATVRQAVAAARSRQAAHDPRRAVLVHGDVHQWNALRSENGFKLVDPDGAVAEPELDLGVLMREDPVELLAGDPWDRARFLAARTGTDPRAIWEWGLADRVATGLTLTAIGLQPVAREMLDAADRIAADG